MEDGMRENSGYEVSEPEHSEVLISMFADALGYDVRPETWVPHVDLIVATALVELRIDTVRQQLRNHSQGLPVDEVLLNDPKAIQFLYEHTPAPGED
jgi:hypothetical protein